MLTFLIVLLGHLAMGWLTFDTLYDPLFGDKRFTNRTKLKILSAFLAAGYLAFLFFMIVIIIGLVLIACGVKTSNAKVEAWLDETS